jgi:hypothetical protein
MRQQPKRKTPVGWTGVYLETVSSDENERISKPNSPTTQAAVMTALKVAIIGAYSSGQLSQERAIRLIRAFGLEAA